jgi:hypothetical protein
VRAALLVLVCGCGDNELPAIVFDSEHVLGSNLAVHDGRVYTTTLGEDCGGIDPGFDHAVWSLSAAGGDPQLILCGMNHEGFGFGMTVADGRVFWSSNGGLYAAPIRGGPRELVANGTGENNVAANGEHVYAVLEEEILRLPLGGGAPEVVFERITFAVGWFDVLDDSVFASAGNEVYKMNLDGSGLAVIATLPTPGSPRFCHDADAIYLVRDNHVARVRRDGMGTTVFASGLAEPSGCAVLDGDVYTSLGGIDASTKKQIVRLRPGNVIDVLAEVDGVVVFTIVIVDRVLHYAGLGAFGRVDL